MAALRHGLLRLKQISGSGGGLGYGRRPPWPVQLPPPAPALGGLQPSRRTLFNISYKSAAGVPGPWMFYYRHGKMVRSQSDNVVGLMEDRSFKKLIFGVDVLLAGLYAFIGYEFIQFFLAQKKTTPSRAATSLSSSYPM